MEPIKFPEANVVYGATQPEYLPLPAYRDDKVVVSCWKLSWRERVRMLFSGRLWLIQKNFGQPLQPQLPHTEYPFSERGFWDQREASACELAS